MSNWVTLSWDSHQILLLTAKGKRGRPQFDRAIRISTKNLNFGQIKEKMRHLVQSEKLAKAETLVVLGRSLVELRTLTFPNVPDDEIPEMARFTAGKEFSELDSNQGFDIFVLPEIEKGKKTVLASAVGKSKLNEIRELCLFSGLTLKCLTFGPLESVAVFAKNHSFTSSKTQLLIEFCEHSTTFSLLYQNYPVFVRSISNGFDSKTENATWLVPEIKKTLFSGLQHLPINKIEQVVISGEQEKYGDLTQTLAEKMQVPVLVLSPWENIARTGEIKNQLPEHAEEFAPLLGAMIPFSSKKPNPLDFLNPKRKNESQQQRQLANVAVMIAILLFAALVFWGYQRRTTVVRENKILGAKITSLTAELDKSEQKRNQADAVESWKKGQVFWLNELHWLSENIPKSEDALLTSLQLRSLLTGSGEMKFQGNARSDSVVPVLESSLSDETHRLKSHKTSDSSNVKNYPYTFDVTITTTSSGAVSRAVPNAAAKPAEEVKE